MTEKKKISIIIPCYNCEEYIEQLFTCLINQTSKDFEIIFINDGSKDNTLLKINEVFNDSGLICKIINQVNAGVSKARNVGLENANGEYIYFLDPDDYIENNLFEDMIYIFENKGIDIVFFKYRIIEDGIPKELDREFENIDTINNSRDTLINLLSLNFYYHMCSFMVKRGIVCENNIKFTEGVKYGEDHEFIIKALCNCKTSMVLNEVYFNYCIRNKATTQSATQTFSLSRLDSIEAAERVYEYVNEYYKEDEKIKKLLSRYLSVKLLYNLRTYSKLREFIKIEERVVIEKKLFDKVKKNSSHLKYYDYNQKIGLGAKVRKNIIRVSPKIFININNSFRKIKNKINIK